MVGAAVLAAEMVFPLWGPRLAGDLKEIDELHEKIRQGCQTPDVSALVLGNSLSLYGFDQGMMNQAGHDGFVMPVKFTFVIFQGAFMLETYHIYKHYIEPTPVPPDVLIVPFSRDGLTDQSMVDIARMVYHCDLSDVHEVVRDELGLARCGEFLHCYLSSAFANRARVRQRVFECLLPDYRESETRLRKGGKPAVSTSERWQPTYNKLDQMLAMCRAKGIHVLMVAMPIQAPYELPPQVLDIIKRHKMDLVDMRSTSDLDSEKYTDSTHLNAEGARVFTRAFVDRLAHYLPAAKLHPNGEVEAAR